MVALYRRWFVVEYVLTACALSTHGRVRRRFSVRFETVRLTTTGKPLLYVKLDVRGRVAQLVEQCPFKAWVEGSSPSALTITCFSATACFDRRFPSRISSFCALSDRTEHLIFRPALLAGQSTVIVKSLEECRSSKTIVVWPHPIRACPNGASYAQHSNPFDFF